MKSKRVLVFNDTHHPYHDPKAVRLMLDVAKDVNVDEVYINGDLLDFYSINSHGKPSPDILEKLEDEIHSGRTFLEELRDLFPKANIYFQYGNHEHRLERFIIDKCRPFFNMVKLETQLSLEALKIDFQMYNDFYQLTSNLRIQHSPASYGVNGARTSLLKKHDMSYVWGCTHRVQYATITGASGQMYEAWFNGCLVDQSSKVFSYTKGHEEWQKCFMIIDIINDLHFGHQCIIKNNSTTLDGSWYEV